MIISNRAAVILVGNLSLSIPVTIWGDFKTGLIVLFGTTLVSLAVSLAWELDRSFKAQQARLEAQLAMVKSELGSKIASPLVSTYSQVIEEGCPLFQLAAVTSYQRTLSFLTTLKEGEIEIDQHAEVFHYLGFLFRECPVIRKIKAISTGEFDEWKEEESWWPKQYFGLHEAAINRGVEIERIFVVSSRQQAKAVDVVFQRNNDYHIRVKVAIQSKISPADLQVANCLLFYDEHDEPRYALVAYRDNHGNFQRAVIHGNPESVRRITEMYNRIDGIARPWGALIAA